LFIVVPPVFGVTYKSLNYISVIDISVIVIEVISFAIYFSFVVAKNMKAQLAKEYFALS
jgi:hypothetical protein